MYYQTSNRLDPALLTRSHCWSVLNGLMWPKAESVWLSFCSQMPSMCKSCPPNPHPHPAPECIAALNSPQCLAVSQFHCDVLTSRSNGTGRGTFSASYWWDRKRLTHREDTRKLSYRGPKRQLSVFRTRLQPFVSVFCVFFSSPAAKRYFVAVRWKWFTGQWWRRTHFADFSPLPALSAQTSLREANADPDPARGAEVRPGPGDGECAADQPAVVAGLR